MRAICILGSPKQNGNTAAIAAEILRGLEAQGVQTALVQLSTLNIGYCRGCKACYQTGRCVQSDDVAGVVDAMLAADLVLVASPSYWGDVTGQMKVFIDRCTPYCNQNAARRAITTAAKGAAVAIRAGSSKQENLQLVHTIGHFLGHLEIPLLDFFTVEGIDTQDDLQNRPQVLRDAFAFGQRLAGAVR
ncbi:MAG TPA: flavodoxin family protein [Candidatus Limiplasma sp.]|nr:flavodoxin family protein [Candidatus Limiplasma sp.]